MAKRKLNPEHYTNLVWKIVHKFSASMDEKEDLFQIGFIGLLTGIERLNSKKQKNTDSPLPYLTSYITGYIQHELREKKKRLEMLKDKLPFSYYDGSEPNNTWYLATNNICDKTDIEEQENSKILVTSMLNEVESDFPSSWIEMTKDYFGIDSPPNTFREIARHYRVTNATAALRVEKVILRIRYKFSA